jgi:hypothetical protein
MKKITLLFVSLLFSISCVFSQTASVLNFDGIDDNIRRGVITTQNNNISFAARVNLNYTTAVSGDQVITYNGNTSTNGYGLVLISNSFSVGVLYGGYFLFNTGFTVTPNTWTHLSATHINNTLTLYVNGAFQYSVNAGGDPFAPSATGGSLTVGSDQSGTINFYRGLIDEVRYWNRALCAAEVSHRASCQAIGNEPGLLACYNFNQGTAAAVNTTVTTLNDITANTFNATLNNFALATGTVSNWINFFGALNTTCTAAPSTATIAQSPTVALCAGNTLTLTGNGLNTYTWSTGVIATTATINPITTTAYSVLGFNTTSGCLGMGLTTVSVNPSPNLTLTSNPATGSICSGTSATLSISGGNTYTWSNNSTSTFIVVNPTTTTIYTLTSTNPSSLGACTRTTAITLSVVTTPTLTFALTPTLVCSATPNATITATGAPTYSWNTGATTNSIAVSPSVTTTYSVIGSNGACIDPEPFILTVNATPTISVNSPTACSNVNAVITASGASTYTWSTLATGSLLSIPNPTNNTTYTVNGRSATGCTAVPVTSTVSVIAAPTLTIANPQPTICSGITTTLTATGASSYIWVGPTTLTNGAAFFPANGSYTAIGTAVNGCTNTAITSISVTTTPVNFPTSTPPAICVGASATISATGATNYTWLPGNSSASFIVVNPTSTTSYTVIKSNANCVDTKVYTLTVNNLPSLIILTSTTTVCSSNTLQLTGGGANNYTWSPPGTSASSIIVTPAVNTIYTLTGSNGTCSNTQTVAINTLPNPTLSIATVSNVICRGFCTTLTAGGALSYTWTTNPTVTTVFSGTQAIDCPTTSTSYSVSGTNSVGCVTGTSQVIVVNLNPVLTASASPPLVCVAGLSTLTAQNIAGVTYSWSTGASTRTNQVSPLSTSVYSVTATFTNTGCRTTTTALVGVFIPTFAITGPTAVCAGGTITINASGASTYTWAGGGFTSTGFPSFAVSPTVPTIYVCTGAATLNGVVCSRTNTFAIGIYLNPTVTAVISKTLVCKGETASLIAGGAATYLWSDNQTGSVVTIAPTQNATTYTVEGVDANGCPGTATVLVRTSFCTGVNNLEKNNSTLIVYPNPSNGEFSVKLSQEMNLNIVDELGRVIKTIAIKESNGFEAKVNGLPAGIYFLMGEREHLKVYQKIIVSN